MAKRAAMSTAPTGAEIPLGLYLHFPWCVSKCPYCDFNSFALRDDVAGRDGVPEDSYVRNLQHDLEHQIETQANLIGGRKVATIFMGGGTPSLFSPDAIGRVLNFVRRNIGILADAEVTLEANPGTIERGRFTEYAAAGINRVSLGAQSFDTEALHALGRIHSPDDTREAVEELRAAGLSNFNLDLMYGLPAQDVERAMFDVRTAITLEPTQISHYHLTLEPGTAFAARPPSRLPSDETTERMLEAASEAFAIAGYRHYEVSAHAREGGRSAHNVLYWQFGDYLGVGAGAHGKLSGFDPAIGAFIVRRSTQQREPRRYQREAGATLIWRDVDPAQRPFEFMLNALRLLEGFVVADFERRTGLGFPTIAQTLTALADRGLVSFDGASFDGASFDAAPVRVRPTRFGLRYLNDLLVEFLPSTAGP